MKLLDSYLYINSKELTPFPTNVMFATLAQKYSAIIQQSPRMSGYAMCSIENFAQQFQGIEQRDLPFVYDICKLIVYTLEGIKPPANALDWLGIQK